MKSFSLTGLVAATHTPFHADGSLNLAIIERQAAHLLANGARFAFIGATAVALLPLIVVLMIRPNKIAL